MNTKAIFKDWERLRVIYNLVLLIIFIFMSVEAYYFSEIGVPQKPFYIVTLDAVAYAFVANTLFLAGPVLDDYLYWLEIQFKYKRHVIFVAGTLLSVAIEIGVLALWLTPF